MLLHQFVSEDAGATAIEYSLIAALIALTILGAVTLMANNVTSTWTTISVHI